MATHYTSTTQTVSVTDYAYGGSSWATISLAVTISAAGAVSYTISCNHSAQGQWQYKGLVATLNGYTIANNSYYSSASECEAHFGKGSRFPINDDSSYSGTAGTVSGGSVSYELKLNCQSDGNVHGWSGSTSTNYKGTTNSGSISRNYWTDVGVGKITSFTDHYNNSYSVAGECGAAGTNNAVDSAKLWYGTGTSSGSYTTSSFGSGKTTHSVGPISVTPTTAAERTIYVAVTTVGKKTTTASDTGWKSYKIKQYLAPNNPTTISLDSSSLRNGRLTIKQDWKYTWSGASSINTSCPIKGYRFCLEKQSAGTTTWTKVALKNSSGNDLSGKMSGSNEYDTTSTSTTFSPSQSGLVAGDKVRLRVKAFTKYGNNNDGTILPNGSYATSTESTVQNAGVMRVCVKKGNKLQWVEGVVHVYVKKNNKLQWVEADIVKTYKSKSWKEST